MKKTIFLGLMITGFFYLSSCNNNEITNTNSFKNEIKNSKNGLVSVNFKDFKKNGFNTKNFDDTEIKFLSLEIKGVGIDSEISKTIGWSKGQAASFSLSVPTGKNRIVMLKGLDAENNVKAILMGITDVLPNTNATAKVNFFETTLALVLEDILNKNPSLLLNLDSNLLRNLIKEKTGYNQEENSFINLSPDKIDTNIISDFIMNNNGNLPALDKLKEVSTSKVIINSIDKDMKINIYKVEDENLGNKHIFKETIINSEKSKIVFNDLERNKDYVAYVYKEGFEPKTLIVKSNNNNIPTILNIKLKKFELDTTSGFKSSSEQFLVDSSRLGFTSSTISTNKNGQSIISFSKRDIDGLKYTLLAKRIDSDGKPIGKDIEIAESNNTDISNIKVIIRDDNKLIAFWVKINQNGNNEINAQKFDEFFNKDGGKVLVVNTKGSTNGVRDDLGVYISNIINNEIILSWLEKEYINDRDYIVNIKCQKFDLNLNKIGKEKTIVKTKPSNGNYVSQINSSSKILENGDIVIAYIEDNNIYFQKYDTNLNEIGDRIKVTDKYNLRIASVNLDSDKFGNIVVSWNIAFTNSSIDENQYVYRPEIGIYFKVYDKNNLNTTNSITVLNNTIFTYSSEPIINFDSKSNINVFYVNNEIVGRKYNLQGLSLGNQFKVNSYFERYKRSGSSSSGANLISIPFRNGVSLDSSDNYFFTWMDNSSDPMISGTVFTKKLSVN